MHDGCGKSSQQRCFVVCSPDWSCEENWKEGRHCMSTLSSFFFVVAIIRVHYIRKIRQNRFLSFKKKKERMRPNPLRGPFLCIYSWLADIPSVLNLCWPSPVCTFTFCLFPFIIVHVPWCVCIHIYINKRSPRWTCMPFSMLSRISILLPMFLFTNQAFSVTCLCYIGGSIHFNFAFHMKHNQAWE